MSVIRVNKTANYTVMSNHCFKEKDMSLKAKGLLSLMLSLPEDWDYSIGGLATLSRDGKDSVMNALKELEEHKYLKRIKKVDDKNQFAGYDYEVFEKPYTEIDETESPCSDSPYPEKPYPENPYPENPYSGNPYSGNPPQLNTNKLNTKLLNNNKYINKYINNIYNTPTKNDICQDSVMSKEEIKSKIEAEILRIRKKE